MSLRKNAENILQWLFTKYLALIGRTVKIEWQKKIQKRKQQLLKH